MSELPTIKSAKQKLIADLKEIGIEDSEAQREAQLILEHATGLSLTEQVKDDSRALTKVQLDTLKDVVGARKQRMPLQYCLEHAFFMGLKLAVRPGVFIPRPDTETLVTIAHKMLVAEKPQIGEIGIGSGAIAISLLKLIPDAQVIACDLSDFAIAASRENAEAHGITDRLTIKKDTWENTFPKQLDAIVSNPPYIPLSQMPLLPPEIALFEPALALFGQDDDGLRFYRDFVGVAPPYLKPSGFVALEFGDGQDQALKALFSEHGWQNVQIHKDLSGLPRVITALRPIKLA